MGFDFPDRHRSKKGRAMTALSHNRRQQLCTALTHTARRAGAIVMAHYSAGVTVELKSDDSPVTAADREAEAMILDELAGLAPDIPVISEEAAAEGRLPDPGERFFLVDALDGTREFIRGASDFTVNIALIEDRVPVMGVIFAPVPDRMFYSWALGEAHESFEGADPRPLTVRPRPERPLIVASRSHRDPATQDYIDSFGEAELVSAGSSLKFCLIAAGEADVYPRFAPTCEWDTGAGHAIMLHAGGHMKRLDGTDFLYRKQDSNYLNPGFIAWGGGAAPSFPQSA